MGQIHILIKSVLPHLIGYRYKLVIIKDLAPIWLMISVITQTYLSVDGCNETAFHKDITETFPGIPHDV